MSRKTTVIRIMASETFPAPYFLTVTLSFCSNGSLPKIMPMIGFLSKAAGTSESALIPSVPSAKKSTDSPVIKAISIAAIVPVLVGMHSTMTGSMVIITYGVKWK